MEDDTEVTLERNPKTDRLQRATQKADNNNNNNNAFQLMMS